MIMSQYSGLLQELQALTENPPNDAKERKALLNALREAGFAVERPVDTVHRLSFAPIQSSVAKTAVDLKLFNIIAAQKAPISLDELAKETGAQPLLLRRILRFCNLFGLVEEPTPMHYMPNERTRTMSMSGMQAGLGHNHDIQRPVWGRLPEFLKGNGYKNIADAADCCFQPAFGTKEPAMVWAMTQPAVIVEFSEWMAGLRDVSPSWLDSFPLQYLSKDTTSTSPVFIDIGGGIGHQCDELLRRMPDTKRPVIVQDLGPPIQHALKTPGLTAEVYDFFTPQPHKDASFYYIKSVLHDWPDDKVVDILKNQVQAMGSDSAVLVDEIVLPEKGGHWRSAEMDIALMACAGSIERTEGQWKELFDQVGLKKVETHFYDDQMLYAVQMLKKA